jgi:hypothetical protein
MKRCAAFAAAARRDAATLVVAAIVALAAVPVAAAAAAAYPPPPASCAGRVNAQPLVPFASAGALANTTRNGKKFVVAAGGAGNLSAPLAVLHLYGSTYEANLAYGQLMRSEVAALAPRALAYIYAAVNASTDLSWLTPAVREAVLEFGVDAALDLTWNATQPFTPAHWADALQGLADGSGVDASSLRRVAMIAEWTRASCSMLGAWGKASASGSLAQLRALDWDTDGPFQEYPMLAVFHPNAGEGFAYATLGWAGMLGSITGVSSSGLALSEKVWDAYKGTHAIMGYAWNFLFQDVLQYDMDTDAALSRMATANRTCAVWLGVGDAHGNGGGGSFKAVQYSHQTVNFFNDRNFPAYPPAHDLFESLVFINKHVQPSSEPCMNDLMHAAYGALSARAAAQYVAALEQTGDMHIAAVDFTGDGELLVSNASPGGGTSAYDAPFVVFSLAALWAEAPPPS